MKLSLFTLTLLIASLSLAQYAAQSDGFKKIDRNGDGKVTREEMPKLFDQIDADKDGIASAAELTAYFAKAKGTATKPVTPGEQTDAAPTPDDVERRPVVIMSDGTRMMGDLYLPKNRKPDERLPAIVFCSGTGGTKKGLPTRLGPILAKAGFVCLGFDYRGWGESDPLLMLTGPVPAPDERGEVTVKAKPVRWQMNLDDQTRDIRCAISFLQGQPEVDANRIGLFGSSYGGGLVTLMAAIDPRVKCVAAQVAGLGTGPQRDKAGYDLLGKQARGETEPIPFETGKLGGKMSRYENMRSNPAKSIGYPEKYELVGRIRIPMIFIDAEQEELSNPKENGEKFASILRENGVPVKYHVIKGITHYGIYKEGFNEATELELAWFSEHLKGVVAKPVSAPASTTTPTTAQNTGAARPSIEQGFAAMDADKNSKLSATEFDVIKGAAKYFKEHPEAVGPFFKKLDADGDGALTLEEYRQIAAQRQRKSGGDAPPAPKRPEAEKEAAKPTTQTAKSSASAADIAFFEKNIRPVLIKSCYECHSAEADKLKAGFALDSRDALLKGGDSGVAVVLGNPEESLLIKSLSHADEDLKMPPEKHGGKLSDSVIADFTEWVKRGVPMPAANAVATNEKMEARLAHWSFQPVKDAPAPAVKNTAWPRSEVDRFVLAELETKGLAPVGDPEPAALLRRVHLDLTGLPPTAEQVTAFLAAPSESRIEGVIDELMKSPQFGERWGRHWLDVARYAESSGKETDFAYPQAWRYRDYVIKAFNQDMPFDQFIREHKEAPFFIYLPHTMIHAPLAASETFLGKSKMGLIGDAIEEIDWPVGQIMTTLQELKIDDNTLVIFTSDNGPAGRAAPPLRGNKGTNFEGGVREPCIMRWPGKIPAGTTCNQIAGNIDMLPTFAKLVGVEPSKDHILDGRDITPLMFTANAGPVRDTHLYIGGNNAAAIRQGDWKLFLKGDAADKKAKKAAGKTKPPKGGPVPSLYNLATDPGETQDVAAANPEIVTRLKQELLTREVEIQANKRPAGKHAEGAK